MRLLLFLLVFPFIGHGQAYVSLIDQDSTSVWKDYRDHVHLPYQGWETKTESVYSISGSSTHNGQTWADLSLATREEAHPIPGQASGNGYVNYSNGQSGGAIREESKHVFYWDENQQSEHLIYDFNLLVGDTVPTPSIWNDPSTGKIESIDSVLIGGSYRKRYHIVDFNGVAADPDSLFIIEGIGSTAGFLLYAGFPFYQFESRAWLSCYKEYGSVLYSTNYPTPTECVTESLSAEELSALRPLFQISQNPVRAGSTISINYEFDEPLSVKVVDLNSQVIKRLTLNQQDSPLEVSFPAGVYFLVVEKGNTFARLVVY